LQTLPPVTRVSRCRASYQIETWRPAQSLGRTCPSRDKTRAGSQRHGRRRDRTRQRAPKFTRQPAGRKRLHVLDFEAVPALVQSTVSHECRRKRLRVSTDDHARRFTAREPSRASFPRMCASSVRALQCIFLRRRATSRERIYPHSRTNNADSCLPARAALPNVML
jgi:hypothetical protein